MSLYNINIHNKLFQVGTFDKFNNQKNNLPSGSKYIWD